MIANLLPFKTLIKEHCGLTCEDHGEEKLVHALNQRIATLAIKPVDYISRLRDDEDELQSLVNLLTVNETYFFREPEQIERLVNRLAPRLLAAHGDTTPIRILSAGCSSGEEPYSLVMALTERYGESTARLFSFFGGDLDSAVLDRARTARYTDFSFRGVPQAKHQRYFEQAQRSHVLKEEIRKQVSFHELNLLATPFPPALRDFDIIFFRNVSIYFDTPTRKIIQRNLASLLKDDGILVIGTAETLANDLGVLGLVEEDGLYYFVKGDPPLASEAAVKPRIPLDRTSPAGASLLANEQSQFNANDLSSTATPPPFWKREQSAAVPSASNEFAAPKAAKPSLDNARQLTRDKRFDEALPELDAVLAGEQDNTEAQLLKAHVLINRKAFAAAEALAQRVLSVNTWSIDALLLLGLAAKWQQRNADAVRHFKQAVYSHHECWPAHYYLADLYRDSGATEPARRAYRVVMQLLGGKEPDTGIQYVPFGLPTAEIRFLCEHQLAKLPGAKMQADLR
ncbi:protein-glutamate O-methyltransferase CheR [Rhodoferax sp.]|uniref:protein-glutamate O-methyltransferase CheR n=1 Tax=Rhodoferax sp. TaxID=50421 RepID=UPI00284D8EE1|nr:protein-glutamate O-methyltransferase CheR [Rhodoferax sp.]MDR3369130.1 protein-glutamate O-methyltransferase CheR [Rhodoferax sp.]